MMRSHTLPGPNQMNQNTVPQIKYKDSQTQFNFCYINAHKLCVPDGGNRFHFILGWMVIRRKHTPVGDLERLTILIYHHLLIIYHSLICIPYLTEIIYGNVSEPSTCNNGAFMLFVFLSYISLLS